MGQLVWISVLPCQYVESNLFILLDIELGSSPSFLAPADGLLELWALTQIIEPSKEFDQRDIIRNV